MIDLAAIPRFTGDFDQLDKDVSALRSEAIGIRTGGGNIHSRFQALGAYYIAPEAEDLLATTQPVMDKAALFAGHLETVADALDAFSIEARPIVKRLEQLRTDATEFVNSVKGDDDWDDDGDKVDRHNALRDGAAEAQAAFEAAERRAASKISAIVGGPRFVEDDGSHTSNKKEVMYGYDADVLKQAEDLPWGDPVSENHHPWEVGYYIKSYVWDGFLVGGAWGAVKGFGHLFGIGGSASDAWGGLRDVVGGIGMYTITPFEWVMDHTIGPAEPDPTEERYKKATREFFKGIVAWDEWKENPTKAAGTVTFNVLTLGAGVLGKVGTAGEVGEAAGSAGRAGRAAKAADIAAKIGTYADPIAAGFTVAGKAVSKLPTVADLASRLRIGSAAASEANRIHSVIELSDGSKVLVKDGEFIPVDAKGRPVTTAVHEEASAQQRVMSNTATSHQPEHSLVGAGTHAPGVGTRAGENLPPQASHSSSGDGGGPSSTGGDTGASSGSGAGHVAGSAGGPIRSHAGAGSHGGSGRSGNSGLSQAERDAILRRQVDNANNNPGWREKYYYSDGRRRSVELQDEHGHRLESHLIPTGDPARPWAAETPTIHPTYLSREEHGKISTVHGDHLPTLHKLAWERKYSIVYDNAAKRVRDETAARYAHDKTVENELAALEARYEYKSTHDAMGKSGEELGEYAAEHHAIPDHYDVVERLDDGTRGSHRFDQIWLTEDNRIVVVEAKADVKTAFGRKRIGRRSYSQGTREYFDSILARMEERGERQLAEALEAALDEGRLDYVAVKAKTAGDKYDGYLMKYFDIRRNQ
ncbi:hypothetical protein AB0L85_10770 [Streptomyces sp. NPDC052051]|uniref:hypothetical protein n=1 Tax=Streptomyces sp. NPDC052051 TaxID=3154649 RepID=UPI00343D1FB2